jgi:predicted AAA+ superfamily ATPase
MLVERVLTAKIKALMRQYPIVAVLGPRQSGKSTLLKNTFPDYQYVTLEDKDIRQTANDDPRGFLRMYHDKVIIDEAQYTPDLFSYLQTKTDQDGLTGQYILSGSQNFLLMKNISQSLAGRVGITTLLPFSYQELSEISQNYALPELIFTGSYPRIYDKKIDPTAYYDDYLKTYVDRDVNELLGVREIRTFNRFLKLVALRAGQVLNVSSLASEAGVQIKTVNAWLSILESSYLIYTLQPYYKRLTKRLIKSPKVFFYDTGLLCFLLGIKSVEQLRASNFYGSLFENFIISERAKKYYNQKMTPEFYFWRDSNGNEVDLLDETTGELSVYEIKAGMTGKIEFATTLKGVSELLDVTRENSAVIYAGEQKLYLAGMDYLPWTEFVSE